MKLVMRVSFTSLFRPCTKFFVPDVGKTRKLNAWNFQRHNLHTTLMKSPPSRLHIRFTGWRTPQWGIWAIWAAKSRFSKNQRRWNTKLPDKDEQCQNKWLPFLSPSAQPLRHTVSRIWAYTVGARIFAERSVRKRALKVNICCRVTGRNT